MGFKQFLMEEAVVEQQLHIETLLFLSENMDKIEQLSLLNEDDQDTVLAQLEEGIHDKLGKAGLKLHKGKGILDYIKSFVGGVGKLMLYTVKGETEKAKELLKSIRKEDIMDFLYKLDLGTLHLFTGPLHMIDAWTGWDLAVKIEHKVKEGHDIAHTVKQAIAKTKEGIRKLFANDEKRQTKLLKVADRFAKEVA